MKDSYLGSMGAVALVLVLLLKYAALVTLLDSHPAVVLLFPVLGRYAIVQLCFACDYARSGGGLGAFFTAGCGRRELGTALAVALAVALAAAGSAGIAAGLGVALWSFGVALYARRRFGGVTGDFLGFVCESGEAVALLVLAALL
jgi:adenosylcobinamide-GDP ribazoletransferase